jgi:hypothetical protein
MGWQTLVLGVVQPVTRYLLEALRRLGETNKPRLPNLISVSRREGPTSFTAAPLTCANAGHRGSGSRQYAAQLMLSGRQVLTCSFRSAGGNTVLKTKPYAHAHPFLRQAHPRVRLARDVAGGSSRWAIRKIHLRQDAHSIPPAFAMSSDVEEEGIDFFKEPADFYEPEKQASFASHQLSSGQELTVRLVGHNPLWVSNLAYRCRQLHSTASIVFPLSSHVLQKYKAGAISRVPSFVVQKLECEDAFAFIADHSIQKIATRSSTKINNSSTCICRCLFLLLKVSRFMVEGPLHILTHYLLILMPTHRTLTTSVAIHVIH